MKKLKRTPTPLGVSIAAICFVLFIALTIYITSNHTNSLDTGFSRYLQAQAWAKPLLYTNQVLTASLFRLLYLLLIGILVAQKRFRFALLTALALASEVLTTVIKDVIQRPRPMPPLIRTFETRTTFSFVSGHTLEHTLLFGILGYFVLRAGRGTRLKYIVAGLFFIEPVLVGLGRVYAGAHWLTDTIGSFLLGVAVLVPLLAYFRDASDTTIYAPRGRAGK